MLCVIQQIISLRDLFIGLNKRVPILDDNKIIPINFDNAATTPVFNSVINKITEACELYGANWPWSWTKVRILNKTIL